MLRRMWTVVLTIFVLSVVISVGISYSVYRNRLNHPGEIGSMPLYDNSDTFITPFNVFIPESSTDVQTGVQASETYVDYPALLGNLLILFLSLCVLALGVRGFVKADFHSERAAWVMCMAAAISFLLGSGMTYSFLHRALEKQQSFANSLVRTTERQRLELNSKK